MNYWGTLAVRKHTVFAHINDECTNVAPIKVIPCHAQLYFPTFAPHFIDLHRSSQIIASLFSLETSIFRFFFTKPTGILSQGDSQVDFQTNILFLWVSIDLTFLSGGVCGGGRGGGRWQGWGLVSICEKIYFTGELIAALLQDISGRISQVIAVLSLGQPCDFGPRPCEWHEHSKVHTLIGIVYNK